MTNSVYKRYRDRLVEITGRSRSLWAKSLTKRQSYPLGRLFEGDAAAAKDFISFLWGDTGRLYRLLTPEQTARAYAAALGAEAAKTVPKAFAEGELSNLRALKREAEELELETGRYELYVGYPFVEGTIDADIPVKAPLLLFPARLHLDGKTELEILRDEPVLLNKVFLLAYARAYRLNFEDVESEFETLKNKFSDVDAVVKFLAGIGVEVKAAGGKRVIADFEKSAPPVKGLEVRNYCVLGRFPLANSIYYDYNALVKKKLTSPALDVLLNNKDARLPKKGKRDESPYFIARMDYAQEQAARRAEGEGDTVIYGPPGTGKSQTLMNILAGSLCRGKRVLVVAQKRAALDVIYSRMGALAEKMVLMPDPEKARNAFYAKTRVRHSELAGYTPKFDAEAYAAVSRELEKEIGNLTALEAALFTRTAFGLTLQEMYALSADAGRSPQDEKTYAALKACEPIKWDYPRFSAAVKSIEERNKAKLYFDFMKASAADPLIEYIKTDLDMHTINKVRAFLKQLAAGERAPFDIAAYPYSRYILAHNLETDGNGDYETLVDMVARQKPHTHTRREIREKLTAASSAIRRFVGEFDLLGAVLEPKGLAMAVDYIAYGNTKFIKKLASSLEDYLAVRDMNLCVRDMSADEKKLLGFALARTQSRAEFTAALKKLLPLRIYHEALSEEKRHEGTLSKTIIFDDLRKRILTLQAQQKKLAVLLAADKLNAEYGQLLAKDAQRGRNFLHQIGKQDKLWPVRRLMEHFEDLLLTMFPCWLLTPEAASAILPLENDMFDLLLFDEASQVFIESAVPAIYRAKRLVVAGDNKQLRPTSVFLKRYTGGDTSGTDDLNTQAVLEVESLLDLAASRLKPAHLTYHYRSKYEELINFSNYAFYEGRLLVAPNVARGRGAPPIERIMVPGRWIDRRNKQEAAAVAELVKKLYKGTVCPTVGIVTFNAEQEELIKDTLDAACAKDAAFKSAYLRELYRTENGGDAGIFVKNLENVQGDERDVIIFSTAYARNEEGKVTSQFGSLSAAGGENRLNVAVTRAKDKIYLVTSVEPEEFVSAETAKNAGPRLFKKYLQYARAVSEKNTAEARVILESMLPAPLPAAPVIGAFEADLKRELEHAGYTVDGNLGGASCRISLAIRDTARGRYLLGIECDYAAYSTAADKMERDVYRLEFLESRGWNMMRIWSRDWWLSKAGVLKAIEKALKRIASEKKP